MPRGNGPTTKVHFKGHDDDFIVIVENAQAVKDWKADRSIPLAQVVDGFKVFVTHKHGTQGIMDTASKGTLETEFGTSNEDEVIIKILEGGDIQETDTKARGGDRNITKGAQVEHGSGHGGH